MNPQVQNLAWPSWTLSASCPLFPFFLTFFLRWSLIMQLHRVGWSPVHINFMSAITPHQAFSFRRALLKPFGGYDFQIYFPLSIVRRHWHFVWIMQLWLENILATLHFDQYWCQSCCNFDFWLVWLFQHLLESFLLIPAFLFWFMYLFIASQTLMSIFWWVS